MVLKNLDVPKRYAVVFFLLPTCIIFNNFKVVGGVVLTDIIYPVLVLLYVGVSRFRVFCNLYATYIFLIVVAFSLISFCSYLLRGLDDALLSQIRFLFGLVVLGSLCLVRSRHEHAIFIVEAYIVVVLVNCIFIFFQNFSFHVFNYHFYFGFGRFDLVLNSTEHIDVNNPLHLIIRTGGFFREPGWFVIYCIPAMYYLVMENRGKELLFLLLGILASTSTLGVAFVGIVICQSFVFSKSKNFRFYSLIAVSFGLVFILFLYVNYGFLFDRFIYFIETGGSSGIRVLDPLFVFMEKASVLGSDTSFLKESEEVFFVNTMVYIGLSWGVLGLFAFIPALLNLKIKHWMLSLMLILTLSTEGMGGRIDLALILFFIFLIKKIEAEKMNSPGGRS